MAVTIRKDSRENRNGLSAMLHLPTAPPTAPPAHAPTSIVDGLSIAPGQPPVAIESPEDRAAFLDQACQDDPELD